MTASPAERLREAARVARDRAFVDPDFGDLLAAWLDVAARIAEHAAARGYQTNEQTAAALALADALLANRSTT